MTLPAWARQALLFILGVAWPAVGVAAPDPRILQAVQDELGRMDSQLKDQDGMVQLVEKQYAGKTAIFGASSFEQRLGEGQIFFALAQSSQDTKNYERAAIALFDVVEAPQFQNRGAYDDALYTLAESLFALKFRYGARTYFQRLAARPSGRFQEQAVVRLIELAGLLGNYEGLDEYFTRYEQISKGRVTPTVRYARGKSLLARNRVGEAEAELSRIPAGDAYFVRAGYLRGVGLIKQGRMEDALAMFRDAAAANSVAPEDVEVKELAHMARGRLYYEVGQLAESADAYQEVAYSSPRFPEMLYEVAWTFVKRGQTFKEDHTRANAEYAKALQALDLLLISNTDKRLESEVRILRGNLLMRLGRHEDAERSFQDVVGAYSPTLSTLDAQMASRGNADQILAELLRTDARSVTLDSVLPPLVRQWASGDDTVQEALGVFVDIASTKAHVAETRELADKLMKYMDAPNRMDLFPALQEGRQRAMAVENALLGSAGRLAEMRTQLVGSVAETPAAADYRTARDSRRALQQRLLAMPTNTEDMAARRDRLGGQVGELEKLLFKQQLEIDTVQAQVAAIDSVVRERKGNGGLSAQEEEYWRNELMQVLGALEQMRAAEKDLKATLKEERRMLGTAGAGGAQESVIRAQYREALQRESQAGDRVKAAVDPVVAPVLAVVDQRMRRNQALLERLDAFNDGLKDQVDGQAQEMRGVIMLERSRIDEYERAVGAYEGEAGEMAAVLTQNALKGVRDQFYDVVLRADVGLIDLAWQEKQEKTDGVSSLVRKQKTDLKTLDEEFQEVLQDVE